MKVTKISNIRIEKRDMLKDPSQVRANANIATESGALWWKKTTTTIREVLLRKHFWIFVDDGEFVPDEINALWRSWQAKQSGKEAGE